ncbi:MAG: glucuronate isomerase [Spirochaetales bacterium]|nr:glucuronate isomerase [Spirochaetales bacterium]
MRDSFFSDNFLLETKTARRLFFDCAAGLPIIDYHSHLPPKDIAADRRYGSLTEIWLEGDHYKWRAMRANGVDERYCTGKAGDRDKFMKWAETVPSTLRNPLYHWTHLELKNPFGIRRLLNPGTAPAIYHEANDLLNERFSVKNLLLHFNVEIVCTCDGPLDSLEWHAALAREGFAVKVLPSFRPDDALAAERPEAFAAFVKGLAALTDTDIRDFRAYLSALRKRHDYFSAHGCRLSDHGWETVLALEYTDAECEAIFEKLLRGRTLAPDDIGKFKSAVRYELAVMDHEAGWAQLFHIGAIRNVNSRAFGELGPNTGYDSIGDGVSIRDLAFFLDRLERDGRLAKTVLFNLNPRDNAACAALTGCFQDGRVPGKIQWGPAWWFLDHRDGIEEHLNVLSSQGLLARFVGMVTDSRSFLSFSRHEYFRRILCTILGREAERGLVPRDMGLLGRIVRDVCYENAKRYFDF